MTQGGHTQWRGGRDAGSCAHDVISRMWLYRRHRRSYGWRQHSYGWRRGHTGDVGVVQCDAGNDIGPYKFCGVFSKFRLCDFAMLGKINFWIVLFYILLKKISPQNCCTGFPILGFSKGFHTQKYWCLYWCDCCSIFLNIYFSLQYLWRNSFVVVSNKKKLYTG